MRPVIRETDFGAERFDLRSGRLDFGSVKLDLRFEKPSLRSGRPD